MLFLSNLKVFAIYRIFFPLTFNLISYYYIYLLLSLPSCFSLFTPSVCFFFSPQLCIFGLIKCFCYSLWINQCFYYSHFPLIFSNKLIVIFILDLLKFILNEYFYISKMMLLFNKGLTPFNCSLGTFFLVPLSCYNHSLFLSLRIFIAFKILGPYILIIWMIRILQLLCFLLYLYYSPPPRKFYGQ